jgi:site-specific recombinase XerD
VGSNPTRDTRVAVLPQGIEDLPIRQLLEMLLGEDVKRHLRLRQMTNDELFESYDAELINRHQSAKALKEDRRVLNLFKESIGQWPPSPETANRYLAKFANRKTWTRYYYTRVINTFMVWYGQKLNIKVRVPSKLPQYVEDNDVSRLLEAMKSRPSHKTNINRDTLLVELALNTGLRRTELANLRVGDIHLNQGMLIIRSGKGDKDAVIPLTANIAARLTAFIEKMYPEDSLFSLKPCSISGKIKWFAKKAGVDLHTHSLRGKFATQLLERGVNPEAVRQLMRHENLGTTQRYVALATNSLQEAINTLDKPINKKLPANEKQASDDQAIAQLQREKLERESICSRYREINLTLGPFSVTMEKRTILSSLVWFQLQKLVPSQQNCV